MQTFALADVVRQFHRCGDLAAGFTRLQCPDCWQKITWNESSGKVIYRSKHRSSGGGAEGMKKPLLIHPPGLHPFLHHR